MFYEKQKTSKMYENILRPFWNFTHKKKVAYGCQSGN